MNDTSHYCPAPSVTLHPEDVIQFVWCQRDATKAKYAVLEHKGHVVIYHESQVGLVIRCTKKDLFHEVVGLANETLFELPESVPDRNNLE